MTLTENDHTKKTFTRPREKIYGPTGEKKYEKRTKRSLFVLYRVKLYSVTPVSVHH